MSQGVFVVRSAKTQRNHDWNQFSQCRGITVNELKLDSEIKKIESILLSARPQENHNYKTYDTFGITESETKFSVI